MIDVDVDTKIEIGLALGIASVVAENGLPRRGPTLDFYTDQVSPAPPASPRAISSTERMSSPLGASAPLSQGTSEQMQVSPILGLGNPD